MKRWINAAAAAALGLGIAGGAQAASCTTVSGDVRWDVTGAFTDGGTVSGCFYTNVYGYMDSTAPWELATSGGSFAGFVYNTADSYISSSLNMVDVEPGYTQDLHLEFTQDLTVATANNPIVPALSYECVGSYTCFEQKGATDPYPAAPDEDYRYLTADQNGGGPSAGGSVPEPEAWVLMILASFATGAALRRQKAQLIRA